MAGNDPLADSLIKARRSVGGTHPEGEGDYGTTGQVLTKTGPGPEDYQWSDPSGPPGEPTAGEPNHAAWSALNDGTDNTSYRSFTPADISTIADSVAAPLAQAAEDAAIAAANAYTNQQVSSIQQNTPVETGSSSGDYASANHHHNSDYVALSGSQSIGGTKTFSSLIKASGGIETNSIRLPSGQTELSFTGKFKASNGLAGKFTGTSGDTSNGYFDIDSSDNGIFRGNAFKPQSSGMDLGANTTSGKWDNLYVNNAYVDGTSLLDSAGKLNSTLLQNGGASLVSAIESLGFVTGPHTTASGGGPNLASDVNFRKGLTNDYISPALMKAELVTTGSYGLTSGSGGGNGSKAMTVKGGSMIMFGFLINWGTVYHNSSSSHGEFGARIDWNKAPFRYFANTEYAIVATPHGTAGSATNVPDSAAGMDVYATKGTTSCYIKASSNTPQGASFIAIGVPSNTSLNTG